MSESAWEGGVGCRRKGANKREIIERLGRRKSLSATPQPSILAFIFILPFMPLCCLLSILPKISPSSKLCSSPWLLSPPSPLTPNRTEALLRCHSPQRDVLSPLPGWGLHKEGQQRAESCAAPPVPPAPLVPAETSQPRPLSSTFVLAAQPEGWRKLLLKIRGRDTA